MTSTPLDIAHAAMQDTDDETARLRFYDRFSAAELFLILDAEPAGDQITPRLFPLEDLTLVLAFDTEERLSDLAGSAPYAVMSGRQLAQMLGSRELGIGLNLGVAPSSFVFDPPAVRWLSETLENAPETQELRPSDLSPPAGLPEALLEALDARLAASPGLARSAYLCGVTYDTGAASHLLAIIDALPAAQDALAQSVSEALTFSGIEAGSLDIAFFDASDAIAAKLAKVGLRFDLPQIEPITKRPAPGSDPDRPPILRSQ